VCSASARDQVSDPAARRKQIGAWYTPPKLVDHVADRVLDGFIGRDEARVSVLDPACGDGRFLAAIRDRLGHRAELVGVDIDPDAIAAATANLPAAEIIHADALSMDWGSRRFDLIVGNPPFLNQMAAATTRGGSSRFGGGPYADTAAEFLALAATLVQPEGGRIGLVLPQSVLSTRDAGAIRRGVSERAAMVHAWWSPTSMFDAAVRTCALVFEAGARQSLVTRAFGPDFVSVPTVALDESWAAVMSNDRPPATTSATLGDVARFMVDFRDQYYGLVGAVGDDVDGPPLVTCGLIEPGRCLWGERPVRFAKQRYAAPRVDLAALSPKLQRWAAERLVPKILIANQTRVIEAVVDRVGAWLPSVPVITCISDDLDRVASILGSDDATRWVRHHAAGSGLSAHAIRLSPTLLASIPLPDP
jgi:SAM-dependent methyltransferase